VIGAQPRLAAVEGGFDRCALSLPYSVLSTDCIVLRFITLGFQRSVSSTLLSVIAYAITDQCREVCSTSAENEIDRLQTMIYS
jgi:hypothetical protein